MNTNAPGAAATRFALVTPPHAGGRGAQGALAAIHIHATSGDSLDATLSAIGVRRVGIGAACLRRVARVDDALIARWSATDATITPHAGPLVVRRILDALAAAGASPLHDDDPGAFYPEAADEFEARTLHALSRARSPRAIDLLAAQPERWRAWTSPPRGRASRADAASIERVSVVLNRLIDPPLVCAIGATNIGKSTLLNALCRREVSIVADEPGVTRDHVGAIVELDGLVVRWVDTPGTIIHRTGSVGGMSGEQPPHAQRDIDAAAAALAQRVVESADLIVSCADAANPFLPDSATSAPIIRLGLRADLGHAPGADLHVAAATGMGLDELAAVVRRALVPDDALHWPGPWAFDETLLAAARTS